MNFVLKLSALALSAAALSTQLSGCGESGETNIPAVKLTASTVVSQADDNSHTHTVTIPFTDISAASTIDPRQYRSETAGGHSHVIALSRDQIIDINNGQRVTVTSSAPDSGTSHTHTWKLLGGNLLYDKYCYNCHSNDKRGHNPMNVSFNVSQASAVRSPSSAQFSVSAATAPDPGYSQPTTTLLDGAALYSVCCSSCHGTLATSSKVNKTFSQIKSSITDNTGGMASLGSLSDAQIQAITAALVK